MEFLDLKTQQKRIRKPLQARLDAILDHGAYIMGPERGNLSDEMQARCDFTLKIPTSFCINVGIAGAIVMYDRQLSRGRFAERPVRAGGPTEELAPHVHGKQLIRTKDK